MLYLKFKQSSAEKTTLLSTNVEKCGLGNYFLRRRLRCVGVMFSSDAMSLSEKSWNKLGSRCSNSS